MDDNETGAHRLASAEHRAFFVLAQESINKAMDAVGVPADMQDMQYDIGAFVLPDAAEAVTLRNILADFPAAAASAYRRHAPGNGDVNATDTTPGDDTDNLVMQETLVAIQSLLDDLRANIESAKRKASGIRPAPSFHLHQLIWRLELEHSKLSTAEAQRSTTEFAVQSLIVEAKTLCVLIDEHADRTRIKFAASVELLLPPTVRKSRQQSRQQTFAVCACATSWAGQRAVSLELHAEFHSVVHWIFAPGR